MVQDKIEGKKVFVKISEIPWIIEKDSNRAYFKNSKGKYITRSWTCRFGTRYFKGNYKGKVFNYQKTLTRKEVLEIANK